MANSDFHKQLLDNLSTALILVDENLRVTYINSAAQALFALSEIRALNTPIGKLFPNQADFLAKLKAAIDNDNPYTGRSTILKPAGHGEEMTVDLVVTPMQEQPQSGLALEFQSLNRILRITREEGLISAQQKTQALIRGLAHEIKNPLGGVRGAAQLLAKQLDDSSLDEYTSIIIAEADRLRGLVDRMLGPHRQPDLQQLNIHEVLEHVCSLVLAETSNQVTVLRDYDPSLPDVIADRAQLIQAILNIMRNAVQATVDNTAERIIKLRSRIQRQFTIGTHRHKLVCRLDVRDNGSGVPEDFEGSLFVPMVSGRAEGTGLGLAISQSIINQHQGVIEYSHEPGWTLFTLYMPLEDVNAS